MGNSQSRDGHASVENVQGTFENVCKELKRDVYDDGVDRDTLVRMLGDFYTWTVVNPDAKIRMPAPVTDIEDTFRFIYPEGAIVRSRSRASSKSYAKKLPPEYRRLSEKRIASGGSVTSTSTARAGASKYVGFADDDEPVKPRSPVSARGSQRAANPPVRFRESNGLNTTPSMEDMMRRSNGIQTMIPEEDDEVVVGDVPEAIHIPRKTKATRFADDDE